MHNKNMNTLAKNGREDQLFKLMGQSREDETQVCQGPQLRIWVQEERQDLKFVLPIQFKGWRVHHRRLAAVGGVCMALSLTHTHTRGEVIAPINHY